MEVLCNERPRSEAFLGLTNGLMENVCVKSECSLAFLASVTPVYYVGHCICAFYLTLVALMWDVVFL